jgi:hypothetical protein
VFAMLYAPYFAWRAIYFGRPFPNTFYAKVQASTLANLRGGLRYCIAYLTGYSWRGLDPAYAPLRWIALVPALFTIPKCRDPKRLLLLGISGGYVTFIALSGGDWMPYNRFFVHIAPILAIMAVMGVEDIAAGIGAAKGVKPGWVKKGAIALAAMMIVGSVWTPSSPFHIYPVRAAAYTVTHPDFAARQWRRITGREQRWDREIGEWMRGRYAPHSLFSTEIAGALPYYSGLPVLDTYGLNDSRVAELIRHNEVDDVAAYILERKPHVFSLVLRHRLDRLDHAFGSPYDRTVFESPEFRRNYRIDAVHQVVLEYKNFEELWLVFLVRRPGSLPAGTERPFTIEEITEFVDAGGDFITHGYRPPAYLSR